MTRATRWSYRGWPQKFPNRRSHSISNGELAGFERELGQGDQAHGLRPGVSVPQCRAREVLEAILAHQVRGRGRRWDLLHRPRASSGLPHPRELVYRQSEPPGKKILLLISLGGSPTRQSAVDLHPNLESFCVSTRDRKIA